MNWNNLTTHLSSRSFYCDYIKSCQSPAVFGNAQCRHSVHGFFMSWGIKNQSFCIIVVDIQSKKKVYNPTPNNLVVSYCKNIHLIHKLTNTDIIEAHIDRLLYIITDWEFLPIKRIERCDVRKTRRKTFVNRSIFL